MSFSFVITDLRNKLNVKFLAEQFNQHYTDYEIIYCSKKQINDAKNIYSIVVDDDYDENKAIDLVVKSCSKKNIVIIRQFTGIDDIVNLTNKIKSDNQIVCFKQKTTKFKNFVNNIFVKLTKVLFSKRLILTNKSAIAYGSNISKTLKLLEKPSGYIYNNDWVGAEYVFIDGGDNTKLKYNKKQNVIATLVSLLVSYGFMLFAILLKTSMLVRVVLFMFSLLAIFICLLYCTRWFIKINIGD